MSINNSDKHDEERDLLNNIFQEGVDEEDTSNESIDDFFDELINGSSKESSEISEKTASRASEVDYILGLEEDKLERNIDSIDEVWPKHTYTLEEANNYLAKLNEKYPIGEITKDLEDIDIFNISFALESGVEWEFEKILKASMEAWKWVSIDYSKGYTLEMISEWVDNRWIFNSLEYDWIGFYNDAPNENEITFLKYRWNQKKAHEFINSLSEEEQKKSFGDRFELMKITSDFSEDEIKKMDDMSEDERANYIVDFIKKQFPDTYSEILPIPGYFEQLVEEKLTSEEKLEIFWDEEKLNEFLDSLDKKESDHLRFESIFSLERFWKPKLQMMPKENLIKFIIGRLGFEIVGKKDPIEEILDNGIDRNITLDKEGRNILSYKYFIETSTEWVNKELRSSNIEKIIKYFTKFNLSSREEIINHVESEYDEIPESHQFMKEEIEENRKKMLDNQIAILENMIKNWYIIETEDGKLELNFKFKENSVNEFYWIE